MRKLLIEKIEISLMTFLLLLYDLKLGENSLFCCNGYSDAIFTILFYESQVKYLIKAFTKKTNGKKYIVL